MGILDSHLAITHFLILCFSSPVTPFAVLLDLEISPIDGH
jgi:hypothetical protein